MSEKPKRKFNFGNMYTPPSMDNESIDRGLKKAFGTNKKGADLKPMNLSGKQRTPEKSMYQQKPLKLTPEKQPEPEDEPYWSAEQWEQWAIQLYDNYPDTHEYLPDWFLQAMEDE